MSNSAFDIKKLLRPLLLFTVILLAFQWTSGRQAAPMNEEDLHLEVSRNFSLGRVVEVEVRNNLSTPIALPEFCPENPLTVERYENGEWNVIVSQVEETLCDTAPVVLQGGETQALSYAPWNSELFNEVGRYRISLNVDVNEREKTYSREIEIEPPSTLRKFWQEALYKPILNILLFLIAAVPGKNLGVAVILLTLLIKLVLVFPNHKALKAQKQMQKVQPQLEALKLKYKDNPQRLAQETMGIYKKYKVNPASSCLPMLIQFPILIALFYVVRDGLITIDPSLLYAGAQDLDLSTVNTRFLGLELTEKNWWILPIVVGGLQFIQMKLTLGKNKSLQMIPKKKEGEAENPMVMMNKGMQYIMPLMVAIFTATLPAVVGIYWGTSTFFGIVQQEVINREKS